MHVHGYTHAHIHMQTLYVLYPRIYSFAISVHLLSGGTGLKCRHKGMCIHIYALTVDENGIAEEQEGCAEFNGAGRQGTSADLSPDRKGKTLHYSTQRC